MIFTDLSQDSINQRNYPIMFLSIFIFALALFFFFNWTQINSEETFLWFWKFTSLGGFTQCRDSDNSVSKCAWFILALLGYGCTLYSVWFSIDGFLKHEYTTKVSYKTGTAFKTKINFPSVTICNKNRVHCGHLYDLIQNCTKVKYCYSR